MISEKLLDKTAKERATIKGQEIAKLGSILKTKVGSIWIEITEFHAIEGGVELYARAWDSEGQIGFGKDGTVDLERFVFINPPILVPDGTTHDVYYPELDFTVPHPNYKEDLQQAILNSLTHTIKVKKQKFGFNKIVENKTGNTTLTVYPNPGTGTAPIDGDGTRASVNEIFTTIRNGAPNFHDDTSASHAAPFIRATSTQDQFDLIRRLGWGWDTSSVGGDDVDSVTVSVVNGSGSEFFSLGDTDLDITSYATPADDTNMENGDFDATKFGTTAFASKTITSLTSDGTTYEDFTLDANGEANINKSGDTYYGMRIDWDTNNSFGGVWLDSGNAAIIPFFADDSTGGGGTDKDPKLVVEHSAAAVVVTRSPGGGVSYYGGGARNY